MKNTDSVHLFDKPVRISTSESFHALRRLGMSEGIILTGESKPEDVLSLKTKYLYHTKTLMDCPFGNEHVIECAALIIKKGGCDVVFDSQAAVIAYAGNALGWGVGADYCVSDSCW